MIENEMTCGQFEERLADYMEGDVQGAERALLDAHATGCTACGALVADLRQIVAQAATLPEMQPPRSVWSGIESRIAAEVVPIATRRRTIPLVRALSAAAATILVTASLTYMATMKFGRPDSIRDTSGVAAVVAQRPTNSTTSPNGAVESTTVESSSAAQSQSAVVIGRGIPGATTSSVRTASNEKRYDDKTAGAMAVYDQEITRLRSVIKRRDNLDPKTIAAIQRSLDVIDTAIAQARAALAADPASAFLNKRLNDAQNKKVELLRTAAMLPST
jgi:hypothetical protein